MVPSRTESTGPHQPSHNPLVASAPETSAGEPADGASSLPAWSDLATFAITFFALGVTVNLLVLEAGTSSGLTVLAAFAVYSATSELAYLAVRDAGGTELAAVVAAWVVASRFGLLALSLGARLPGGRWHRAIAAINSFDPNVAIAIQQTDARLVARAFWRVTAALMVGWWTGTVVGVFLGNVIGDADRFGLDALFPAAMLAIIGNGLRQRDGALAALIGGGLCLVLIPLVPAGVPIIASVVGAVIAVRMTAPAGPTGTGTAAAGETVGPAGSNGGNEAS